MDVAQLLERVVSNPKICRGRACIKGTRITVYDVLEYLAGGSSERELLEEFPALTADHLRAALAFAAARERRLASGLGV